MVTWALTLAQSLGNPFTLMMVAGIILLIVTVLRIPRVTRRKREARDRGEKLAAQSPEVKLRRTMEDLLVEIYELSREMNARIDTKMRAFEALLRRAEEVAARLEKADAAGGALDEPVESSKYEEIYRLADEGKSVAEIARASGEHPGEIELILNLRRRR